MSGPWSISQKVPGTIVKMPFVPTSTADIRETCVYGGKFICEGIERLPDMHLISAAPDMYEALRVAVKLVPPQSRAHKQITDAIAKAEGRSDLGSSYSHLLSDRG